MLESFFADDSRFDSLVVRMVANRRLKTLENLEKLIRPARLAGSKPCTPCFLQRADPNSCNTGICATAVSVPSSHVSGGCTAKDAVFW